MFFNIGHEAAFPELLQTAHKATPLSVSGQSVSLNLHILHYTNDTLENVVFDVRRWIFPRAQTDTETDGKQKSKKKGRKKS